MLFEYQRDFQNSEDLVQITKTQESMKPLLTNEFLSSLK